MSDPVLVRGKRLAVKKEKEKKNGVRSAAWRSKAEARSGRADNTPGGVEAAHVARSTEPWQTLAGEIPFGRPRRVRFAQVCSKSGRRHPVFFTALARPLFFSVVRARARHSPGGCAADESALRSLRHFSRFCFFIVALAWPIADPVAPVSLLLFVFGAAFRYTHTTGRP